MKKAVLLPVLGLVILLLTSCAPAGGNPPAPAEAVPAAAPATVDLDLSGMSGTVVYAQVYNLLSNPEEYMGKTIRIAGCYSVYEDTELNKVYHACVIPDATACCAQGLEFVWKGDHTWPDDYPEEMTGITVTGRLDKYEELGLEYLHLVDADLVCDPSGE